MPRTSEDEQFCAAMLPEVSRTFALSITTLPPALLDTVRTAYLLCRVADTIEDAAEIDEPTRGMLFDELAAQLGEETRLPAGFEQLASRSFARARGVGDADRRLCAGAGAPLRRHRTLPVVQRDAIRSSALEMIRGMREYAGRRAAFRGRIRIESAEDLERYCYYVAGTVGEMLTGLFLAAYPQPEALRRELHAREVRFGIALQLVNVLKDVADDLERGVCWLPADLLAARGLDPETMLAGARRDDAVEVLQLLAARARAHLVAAGEWVACWPPSAAPVRQFAVVPLVLALRTLRLLEEGGPDVLQAGRSPKVSRMEVAAAASASVLASQNDQALHDLIESASRGLPVQPPGL